jgi:hypothetical protein
MNEREFGKLIRWAWFFAALLAISLTVELFV